MELDTKSLDTKSPKNASTLSVKASLKSRIRTSDQAGTHEYFVVQRETVQGELLAYQARKAVLNQLFEVSKSWVSAVAFRGGDAEIALSIELPLAKKGCDKNREPEWWLCPEYCARKHFLHNDKEVCDTDQKSVLQMLECDIPQATYDEHRRMINAIPREVWTEYVNKTSFTKAEAGKLFHVAAGTKRSDVAA